MESEIAKYVSRAENAELQINDLVKELEALEKGVSVKGLTKPKASDSSSNNPKPGKLNGTDVLLVKLLKFFNKV